ncbi:MAG: flagellar biosynthesis anti-sigma factor FlgM [Thermodesulfobacteriaceae bacterium]|nr:flagellar biosynthesis anti-sigma factor FlgM [Thermodesulfobacteriaceae bacterium]
MPINNINNNLGVIYMKIDEIGGKGVQNLGEVQERTRRVRTERVSSEEQNNSSDRVELSTKTLTETAIQKASSFPEVREERVAQIRAQIQQGTYQVSNRQIARAMLGTLINEIV